MAKRKRRGRDWHAWAWYSTAEDMQDCGPLFHYAEPEKPSRKPDSEGGKWVRVRFVPVDPLPKAKVKRGEKT